MKLNITPASWALLLSSTVAANTQAHDTAGPHAFEQIFTHTNGRSCATCHVLDEHTTLAPESVARRLAEQPQDALFQALDADDPSAPVLRYEHLKKGLVRVVLPLPDNMDVIDAAGNVVTTPERSIFVWRGVPSIENTALTAPYQLDGRIGDLPAQALAAIEAHAQGGGVPERVLEQIADFERSSYYSSGRARGVARLLEAGVPLADIPIPERTMRLSAAERRGRELFERACDGCHGGASTREITDRTLHDALFFALGPDGNVLFDVAPDATPAPRLVAHPSEFLNIGFGLLSGYGQLGVLPLFNASVELPRYRFRFYSDGSRQHQVSDLPPIPVTASDDPLDLSPVLDERGAPIFGPSLGVQPFSTDPGRAIVTGDPLDFEAFDVPQLRGVVHTAPYFHDNSAATLRDVVDAYSRFILPFPALGLPPIHPPEVDGGPAESLSRQQKADLLAFLQRL